VSRFLLGAFILVPVFAPIIALILRAIQ